MACHRACNSEASGCERTNRKQRKNGRKEGKWTKKSRKTETSKGKKTLKMNMGKDACVKISLVYSRVTSYRWQDSCAPEWVISSAWRYQTIFSASLPSVGYTHPPPYCLFNLKTTHNNEGLKPRIPHAHGRVFAGKLLPIFSPSVPFSQKRSRRGRRLLMMILFASERGKSCIAQVTWAHTWHDCMNCLGIILFTTRLKGTEVPCPTSSV